MKILPLPAIDGIATVDWELAGNVDPHLSTIRTLQREVHDGDHWVAQLRFPPNVDEEAGIVDAWQAQARRGDRWTYLSPPQNKLRGAWSLPELVSNGTFLGGATTGWAGTGATLSVNARRLKVKNSGAAIGYARQTLTVTADVPLVLLVDLYPGNVSAWRIRLLDGADVEEHVSYYNQAGRVPIVHIPASTTLKVELACNTAVAGDDVKFGNVTCARCLLVKDSLAVGNTLTVKGGPASTDAAIKAGQFVTIRLWNGWQMVRVIEDVDFDANGEGTLRFEAALRDGVLGGGPVIVHQPFVRMVFSDPRAVASVRAPMIHETSIGLMEDVTPLDGEVPHDIDIIWEWDANSFGLEPTIGEGTSTVTSDADDNYYFDSDGKMKKAAANSPVFEFDPVKKYLKGQRFQGQRTNLAWPSEDLNHANYLKTDTTVTSDAIDSPLRSAAGAVVKADLLTQGSAGTGRHGFAYTATADTHQVGMRLIKRGNHDWVQMQIRETSTDLVRAWFNLSTGAVSAVGAIGTATNAEAFMLDVGDGWYLCIVMGNVNNAATGLVYETIAVVGSGSVTRVSNGTRYETAYQVENNVPFWSSYIPTLGASVARSNDTDVLSLINLSGFPQTGYVLECEVLLDYVEATGTDQRKAVCLNDGAADEEVTLFTAATTPVDFDWRLRDGAATLAQLDGPTVLAGVVHRSAAVFAANDGAAYYAGANEATDVSLTMPTLTILNKGSGAAGAAPLFGYLRRLRMRKVKPHRQVQALSA